MSHKSLPFRFLRKLQRLPGVRKASRFIEAALLRLLSGGCFEGIYLTSMSFDKAAQRAFVQRTTEALGIIREHDARRFRRIKETLRFIIEMRDFMMSGSYEHRLRACHVDMARLNFADYPAWSMRFYCCLIVHETTHGYLENRGIKYEGDQRERIERICHREEERFARRAWPDRWREVVPEFDASQWKESWDMSSREYWAKHRKQVRKILREWQESK